MLFALPFLMLRCGLLPLCVEMVFAAVTYLPEGRTSAWYFAGTAFVLAGVAALAAWAFHVSLGGRKLWKEDFFG